MRLGLSFPYEPEGPLQSEGVRVNSRSPPGRLHIFVDSPFQQKEKFLSKTSVAQRPRCDEGVPLALAMAGMASGTAKEGLRAGWVTAAKGIHRSPVHRGGSGWRRGMRKHSNRQRQVNEPPVPASDAKDFLARSVLEIAMSSN